MIAKLFRRLTVDPGGGGALFDWATAVAREPSWYVEGGVPDTIDGRFAMVSTIAALCCVRLEQLGPEGEALSVALTERFAAVMESEHRELGLGDPTLGKTVLKLVGSLARRVDLLRPAMKGEIDWPKAAEAALPGLDDNEEARVWRAAQLEKFARRLQSAESRRAGGRSHIMSANFAYHLKLDQIGQGLRVDLGPSDGECAEIARRLGLVSLDRLEAHAVLSRDGARVHAEGRVLASLEQSCVVTGVPVSSCVDEPFAVDFLPEPKTGRPDEEVEIGADDCDIMFHDGASVDLGAAVVDSLALALDPYPRSAGAEATLREAGVISEEEAGPFAALGALRDKLGKP